MPRNQSKQGPAKRQRQDIGLQVSTITRQVPRNAKPQIWSLFDGITNPALRIPALAASLLLIWSSSSIAIGGGGTTPQAARADVKILR